MEYTKRKFLLEMENYFTNFPDYTVGEIIYSFVRVAEKEGRLIDLSDGELIEALERAQFIETNN